MLILSRSLVRPPERVAMEDGLLALAQAAGRSALVLDDLYHLDAECGVWDALRRLEGAQTVAGWLHPRPLEVLLRSRGVWREGWRALSLLACADAPSAWELLASAADRAVPAPSPTSAAPAERWYPLVDPADCRHCGRCAQFCIFGVYALGPDGRIAVANPDHCKPGCPACSRICPHGAIIFPLYAADPAIAGAPGRRMRLDAAGRRLFYQRTGAVCPACAQAGKPPWPGGGPPCAECGRPGGQAAGPDALDGLIASLDRLDRGRGR